MSLISHPAMVGKRAILGASCLQSARYTMHGSRNLATIAPVGSTIRPHKIVIIGGGSAGIALSYQLLRKGRFAQDDIAIIDPAQWHHYQPGWTLVGGGLKNKHELRKPMSSLIGPKFKFYNKSAHVISPKDNYVTLEDGDKIGYEHLIITRGVRVDFGGIEGLPQALADSNTLVSSIYDYNYCDKTFESIRKLRNGTALFTQPSGVIKCAGAPQKIMWLALDYWKRKGLYDSTERSPIDIIFATGLPTMFGVPKYSTKLNELRLCRGVEGLFEHNLIAVDGQTATFARPGKDPVQRHFDFLHVAPRNVPHPIIRKSGLANEAGFVDVDEKTTRHKTYGNVWSIGDAAGLPTSKTMAAITSQAPVLVSNLISVYQGSGITSTYDGYTSCPILTGDDKVILAEFGYDGIPKETFKRWFGIDQTEPRRTFFHMKKYFFPWVYKLHLRGRWGGPKGLLK